MANKKINPSKKWLGFQKDWDYGTVKAPYFSFGIVKFHKLYNREKTLLRYFVAFIASIFIGIFTFFLLQGTGIYNLGISGFLQGLARMVTSLMHYSGYSSQVTSVVYYVLFWLLNLMFNIPLAIFGYLKIGKQFALISIISIVISSITGLILSLIPHLNQFYIFSDPRTFNTVLLENHVQILQWSNPSEILSPTGSGTISVNDSSRLVILFIYGIVIGVLTTIPTVIVYIIGGANGGTDWYLFYYSKIKQKSVAVVSMYANLILTFFAFILGTYFPYVLVMKSVPNQQITNSILISNFFSATLLATFLSAWIRKIIINIFYPQFKVVITKIYTQKTEEIRAALIESKFIHSFTINNSVGGYSKTPQKNFEITCFYNEIPQIMTISKTVDPNSLLIASPIIAINGRFKIKSNLN